jgi:DNA-binding transcriptional regulator YiaG
MTEDIDRHMGNRLRVRRRALDMTQQALAAKLNVGFRQVHKYETAVNRCRLEPSGRWPASWMSTSPISTMA